MLNEVFLVRFPPMVTSFGPWKVPKFLANGPFWDQKGVKSGSKVGHCKNDPGPFLMLQQVFPACLSPW